MILPAILEENLEAIKNKIELFDEIATMVQIDFVDNTIFAGHTYLGIDQLDTIKTKVELELHLLVKNPARFLVKVNNAVSACSQIEATDISDFISKAKGLGYKVGLSLAPETPIQALDPYIKDLDYVQFMTIKPGGQHNIFSQ